MLDIFIKWLIPFVCGGVVSGCIAYVKGLKKKNSALEDGLQCLLRAEIIHLHDKYTESKSCPIYAKESLKRMYAAYHDLGGNDVATQLYKRVMALPSDPGKDKRSS